jgi:hypothetical protein
VYCLCVNVYCHRVSTQLQLTNIQKKYQSCHQERSRCIYKSFEGRNIVLLTTRVSDVAKLTIRTPLSSLSSCKLLFQIVGLKIRIFLPNFALKSPDRFFIWCLGTFLAMPSLYVNLIYDIYVYIFIYPTFLTPHSDVW